MGNSSDEFKAIGMPLIMIATFAAAIAVNHHGFIRAFQQSKYNLRHFALWLGAFASALLSMFLYFTSAWAYGLVCTLVCYLFTLLCGTPSLMDKHAKSITAAVAIWFATLVGVPSFMGKGAVAVVSQDCEAWFGTVAKEMCVKGWLAWGEIVVMILIAVTFLSLMTLMGNAAEGSSESVDHPGEYAAVGVSASGQRSYTANSSNAASGLLASQPPTPSGAYQEQ